MHDSRSLKEAELALFDVDGERISIDGKEDATLLVLNGERIHEPIARHGPFVMEEELMQATNDYQAGKMGHL